MFTEPISLTKTGGSAVDLARTGMSDNSGTFSKSDGALKLYISHSYGRRNRHTLRLVDTKTTADPLVSGSSFIASASLSLSMDVPVTGYTVTEMQAICGALTTWLSASTGANPTKLWSGES